MHMFVFLTAYVLIRLEMAAVEGKPDAPKVSFSEILKKSANRALGGKRKPKINNLW